MAKVKHTEPRVRIPELKKELSSDFRMDGKKIYLRPIREKDATQRYCDWLNDPEVNRYTESRYVETTLADLGKYIGAALRSPGNFFFAIIEKSMDAHVGNIKIDSAISPLWDHLVGEVGLIIGEKSCWGRGYASEAIELATQFAFETLRLHKLTATCYSVNPASAKAFLKAGYTQEAVRPSNAMCEGKYVDLILLGVINPRSS